MGFSRWYGAFHYKNLSFVKKVFFAWKETLHKRPDEKLFLESVLALEFSVFIWYIYRSHKRHFFIQKFCFERWSVYPKGSKVCFVYLEEQPFE